MGSQRSRLLPPVREDPADTNARGENQNPVDYVGPTGSVLGAAFLPQDLGQRCGGGCWFGIACSETVITVPDVQDNHYRQNESRDEADSGHHFAAQRPLINDGVVRINAGAALRTEIILGYDFSPASRTDTEERFV